MPELTPVQVDRVVGISLEYLGSTALVTPIVAEREPAYVARAIAPGLRERLNGLGVHGLVVTGEGIGPVVPVGFLGLPFYADLAVTYFGKRILAFEAKYLSAAGRQNAVATALGQALIYKSAGHIAGGALLLDLTGDVRPAEAQRANGAFNLYGVNVITRRLVGRVVGQDPRQ